MIKYIGKPTNEIRVNLSLFGNKPLGLIIWRIKKTGQYT